MCGIFCLLHYTQHEDTGIAKLGVDDRLSRLQRRGPDGCVRLSNLSLCDNVCAELHGCILHLRGPTPVLQPLLSRSIIYDQHSTSFLLWNGEVLDGIDMVSDANDTEVMLKVLEECDTENCQDELQTNSKVLTIMSKASSKKLWFGRDVFGRRSLLWSRPTDKTSKENVFRLSSVISRPRTVSEIGNSNMGGESQIWEEVPANGIFCIDLSCPDGMNNYFNSIHCYTWQVERPADDNYLLAPVTKCVREYIPNKSELEIIYDEINVTSGCQPSSIFSELIAKVKQFQDTVCQLEVLLSDAVKRRVASHAQSSSFSCKTCTREGISIKGRCVHAKVAVLFSGGLDSTVLCALANRFVPMDEPIDLLNVAFEVKSKSRELRSANYNVPDRISGRKALEELKKIAPRRQWNFVEVNVSKEELDIEGESEIADVIYPLTTVLDYDLGCAVWFAARGKGIMLVNSTYVDYSSPAKVVITGIGADEQLGGYSRHRVCYKLGGWAALITEIKMEMNRISQRNLGRDDRVIADHGREGRFPFLDEHLVNYLNDLPIHYKVNLDLPQGVGDKLLLRALAFKLGLESTSSLAKRALQFGSRIAQMETGRQGSDTCKKLLAILK